MSGYEWYIEILLKLQKCYRVQNILKNDLVSKIDLTTRPRIALTLAVALWSINKIKQGVLNYSDVVYLQKRLARFISESDQDTVNILKKLLDLAPMRYGMDVQLAARRCAISENLLLDTIRAFNMIRDVIDMTTVLKNIDEPIRHESNLCLNDVDMLPPVGINSEEYLNLIIRSLKNSIDRINDPTLEQVIELLYEEVKGEDITHNDQLAIVLIIKLITDIIKPNVLCADPCINVAAFSQKFLNDLSTLGVDPSKSKFYKLYQDLSIRSIVHGTSKSS